MHVSFSNSLPQGYLEHLIATLKMFSARTPTNVCESLQITKEPRLGLFCYLLESALVSVVASVVA